jgi:tRNA(fMet)-specific endonuclease VapC
MFILDTDTLSHFLRVHGRVTERVKQAGEEVVITLISRIEVLQGRFASVLKAEDGEKLIQAQRRLEETEADLRRFTILAVGPAVAEFDRLRENRKLKKIRRGDLLIACIALAYRATLVTRNLKDFRQVPGLRVENWVD